MKIPISVIVLTKNSARHVEACLASVRSFDEVVVYDNGSEDETPDIAQRFPNVNLLHGPFIGFGPLRRLVTREARNDWILALDSDEELTPALIDEIGALVLDPQAVYAIPRQTYYRDIAVRCCGWSSDVVIRLFDRRVTEYDDRRVHESVIVPPGMRVRKLEARINHYSYEDVASLLDKMQAYSGLYAEQYAHVRKASVGRAVFRALFAFFKSYFLQRGILAGATGFLISVTNANGVFYKYMKLREKNGERSDSRPTAGKSSIVG
uniref:Glycosyltransferase involved in cell wall bisynthesis n=1 Tax=Candidatus Kentrum sp. DK TaxID=2126562 RepID=A0A450SVJ7_9GAMM|nr:MAG: Glycosyltransferase involved in cell wall bisynthesis [Candidatus Kentron sp. DK]